MAILSAIVSAQRSKGFFKLIDKFDKFDTVSLQKEYSSHFKTQIFYLLYALSIEAYYLLVIVYYSDIHFVVLLMWALISMSTILMIIQYVIFVGLIREKYKSANHVFSSSKYYYNQPLLQQKPKICYVIQHISTYNLF